MCLLLAEFLRESLALGAEDRIPLSRELALARKYLEVERVRFGDRLGIEIESSGVDDCMVPSLILQPVVENAVTHGIAHLLDGGVVRIVTSCSPARIVLLVDNPCDADRPKRPGGGVGLANVRSRVRALYGTEASVTAFEQDGHWRVEISLPTDVAPAADCAMRHPRLVCARHRRGHCVALRTAQTSCAAAQPVVPGGIADRWGQGHTILCVRPLGSAARWCQRPRSRA